MAAPAGAAAGEAAAVATEGAMRSVCKALYAAFVAVFGCIRRGCNFCGGWCVVRRAARSLA